MFAPVQPFKQRIHWHGAGDVVPMPKIAASFSLQIKLRLGFDAFYHHTQARDLWQHFERQR